MRTTVDCDRLNAILPDIERCAAVMEALSEQLSSPARSYSSLKPVYTQLQSTCSEVRQLGCVLESIASEYTAVESRLCHTTPAGQTEISTAPFPIQDDAALIFGTYNFSSHFVNDVDFFTVFGYFFSRFDDNMKAVFNSCGNLGEFWDRLTSGTLSENIADEFMNDKDNVKSLLSGVVESMFENKVSSKYKGTELKTLKALDKLSDVSVSEDMRQVLDGSYAINKGLTKTSKLAEKVEYLLTDYSDNIEFLNSLREIAPGSRALNEIVDDILFDYEHKFTAMVRDEVLDKIEDFSKKNLDSLLGTNFGLVNTAIKGTIGQVPALDAMDTVVHIAGVKSSAIQTYRTAVDVIKAGGYSEADFKAYVNSFNLCKELTLKEYRSMLKYYGNPYSKEHLYLQSQISTLENMTYKNAAKAPSFTQFNASSSGRGYGGMSSSGSGFGGGGGGGRGF